MKNKLSLMTVCGVLLTLGVRAQDTGTDLQAGLTAYYPLNGPSGKQAPGLKLRCKDEDCVWQRIAPAIRTDRITSTSAVGCWCRSLQRLNQSRR